MSSRSVLGLALAVVVLLPACSEGQGRGSSSAAQNLAGDAWTGDCSEGSVRARLDEFLALDWTNPSADFDRYIASTGVFRWFSARDRLGPPAYDRESLRAYLVDRRARGVQQRFFALSAKRHEGEAHTNLVYQIDETDRSGTTRYWGKGAFHCSTGTIMVWSEGTPS